MADQEDDKVSQRYRELGKDEPPPKLDAAILAAARRAAAVRPAPLVPPTGRLRWYFPVAAAAIIVLAVAVTMHVEREQPDPEAMAVLPAEKIQQAPPEEKQPAKPEPRARLRKESKPAAPPAAEMPKEERPSSAADSVGAVTSQRSESKDLYGASASKPQAAPAPEARAPAARAMQEAELPPERWLERIALLREQGRHEEADKALADFKRRYPEYRIPDATLKRIEKK